jgi:hypothetical protein
MSHDHAGDALADLLSRRLVRENRDVGFRRVT